MPILDIHLWVVESREKNTDNAWVPDFLTPNEQAARQWAYDQHKLMPQYDWRVRELPPPGSAEGEEPQE